MLRKAMSTKCEHNFKLDSTGEVTCAKCGVFDDEMEVVSKEIDFCAS